MLRETSKNKIHIHEQSPEVAGKDLTISHMVKSIKQWELLKFKRLLNRYKEMFLKKHIKINTIL